MKHVAVALVLFMSASAFAQDWVAPMQAVHATFTGNRNTIACWGDSITATGAFYLGGSPSNVGSDSASALSWYNSTERNIGTGGALSGSQTSWALQSYNGGAQRNIDYWLATDKPEMVVILWGTNECKDGTPVATYQANMTAVVETCKAAGTIPILTTPPPQDGHDITPYCRSTTPTPPLTTTTPTR